MKLYYVEQKQYYRVASGYDIQMADGGQTPILYKSADRAIRRANRMTDVWIDTYDYQVKIDNDNYPMKGSDIIFGTRLEEPMQGSRVEIRIYEIETKD